MATKYKPYVDGKRQPLEPRFQSQKDRRKERIVSCAFTVVFGLIMLSLVLMAVGVTEM